MRERSEAARSKRSDLDERAKSLHHLRHTRHDLGVAELPAGSMPGSSRDGAAPPRREQCPYEKDLYRMEGMMDEMLCIKEK